MKLSLAKRKLHIWQPYPLARLRSALPYVFAEGAKLTHRPRSAILLKHHNGPMLSIITWCNHGISRLLKAEEVSLMPTPMTHTRVCAACERNAVRKGELSSGAIVRSPVVVGAVKSKSWLSKPLEAK